LYRMNSRKPDDDHVLAVTTAAAEAGGEIVP
jgi:hypothetical protein